MKVLIADDEDYTREGLIEAVDWEKFGIDEIMQAVNGAEAARIAQWFVRILSFPISVCHRWTGLRLRSN